MKTKTIKLYEYSELSPEAKNLAHDNWNSHFDTDALTVCLDNNIEELLEKQGIKPLRDLKGYDTKYAKIYYSLANCQGDGVMFEGVFEWKKYSVHIKQSGHYYHSNSKSIEITYEDSEGNEQDADEKTYEQFEAIYQSICKTLEKAGYEFIEEMQSEDAFIEACNANE